MYMYILWTIECCYHKYQLHKNIFLNKFHFADGIESEKFEPCGGQAFTHQIERLQVNYQANLIIFIN